MTFDAAGDAVFDRYFAGDVAAALDLTEGLADRFPAESARIAFWRACLLATLGREDDAVAAQRRAPGSPGARRRPRLAAGARAPRALRERGEGRSSSGREQRPGWRRSTRASGNTPSGDRGWDDLATTDVELRLAVGELGSPDPLVLGGFPLRLDVADGLGQAFPDDFAARAPALVPFVLSGR